MGLWFATNCAVLLMYDAKNGRACSGDMVDTNEPALRVSEKHVSYPRCSMAPSKWLFLLPRCSGSVPLLSYSADGFQHTQVSLHVCPGHVHICLETVCTDVSSVFELPASAEECSNRLFDGRMHARSQAVHYMYACAPLSQHSQARSCARL